jgi:nucleotide-binding universal stress UspA family protein
MVYNHVLVPLDGSGLDKYILPLIEVIIRNGLSKRVTFLHVIKTISIPLIYVPASGRYIELNTQLLQEVIADQIDKAAIYLKKIICSLNCSKTEINWQVLSAGGIAESIVNYAANNEVDFIIMATCGRSGIWRWIWGSVTYQVLCSVHIPVFALKVPRSLISE